MKLTDQEKLALITEAVQDMKKSILSNFAFCIVVGAIVDQPEVSLDDLAWGAKQLAAIREAVEHSVHPTLLQACGICHQPTEGGRAICLSCANTQSG